MKNKVLVAVLPVMFSLVLGCQRRADKFYELGQFFEERRQFGQAAVEYQKALDEDPTFVDAHYRLGRALRGANMLEPAEEAFQQTVKLDPGHAEARVDLAEIYFTQDKLSEARGLLETALEIKPDSVSAYILLGGILLEEKKYTEAAKRFERVLVKDPKNAEVHYALAHAYFFDPSQDRKVEAIKEIRRAARLGYPIQKALGRFDQELRMQGSSLQALEKKLQASDSEPQESDTASAP